MNVATHRLSPKIADALQTLAGWVCQGQIEHGDTTIPMTLPLWIKVSKVGTSMQVEFMPPPEYVVAGFPDPVIERINIWPTGKNVGELVAKGRIAKFQYEVDLVRGE